MTAEAVAAIEEERRKAQRGPVLHAGFLLQGLACIRWPPW